MKNRVLVHHCFDYVPLNPIELPVGDTSYLAVENPNRTCSCQKRVGNHERDDLVRRGLACVILKIRNGHRAPDINEIVELKTDRTPRAATIEEGHIERAYVECQINAQERIEIYGALTQGSFVELGAEARLRGRLTPPTEIAPPQPGESAAIRDIRYEPSQSAGIDVPYKPKKTLTRMAIGLGVECRECGNQWVTETSDPKCASCGSVDIGELD